MQKARTQERLQGRTLRMRQLRPQRHIGRALAGRTRPRMRRRLHTGRMGAHTLAHMMPGMLTPTASIMGRRMRVRLS